MVALIDKLKQLPMDKTSDLSQSLFPMIRTNLSKHELLSLFVNGYKARKYTFAESLLPIDGSHQPMVHQHVQMMQVDLPANVSALHEFIFGEQD